MRDLMEINKIQAMIDSPDKDMQDLGMTIYVGSVSPQLRKILEGLPRDTILYNVRGSLRAQKHIYENYRRDPKDQ